MDEIHRTMPEDKTGIRYAAWRTDGDPLYMVVPLPSSQNLIDMNAEFLYTDRRRDLLFQNNVSLTRDQGEFRERPPISMANRCFITCRLSR